MSVETEELKEEEEPRDELAPLEDEAGEISAPVTDSEGTAEESESEEEYNAADEPEPHELRAGGASRTHDNGNIYWLNVDQLREFNRMDRTLKEDNDFWAWF